MFDRVHVMCCPTAEVNSQVFISRMTILLHFACEQAKPLQLIISFG